MALAPAPTVRHAARLPSCFPTRLIPCRSPRSSCALCLPAAADGGMGGVPAAWLRLSPWPLNKGQLEAGMALASGQDVCAPCAVGPTASWCNVTVR